MTGPLPVLFVAGLGRCSTTMMMTMLDAGSFPTVGPRPSYEPYERWRAGRPDPAWIAAQGGRAVKWIDPTNCRSMPNWLPAVPVIILMERRPREQARSQIKLVSGRMRALSRRAEKAMERSIRRDMPLVRARMRTAGPTYIMSLEDVLAAPLAAASRLGEIVDEHFGAPFDAGTASRVVIARGPECQPHMNMETIVLPALAAEMSTEARP